jgi:hypothetical protein
MQPITTIDITIVVFPSILLGIMFGYLIGELTSLRLIVRVGFSLIASILCGVILSLLLNSFVPISVLEVLLSSISVLGGIIVGLGYNWTPPPELGRRSHIIYEPYDDEDFEREMEESLRGKL